MQTAILVFAFLGLNFGLVEYVHNDQPAYLLCIDDGWFGHCYDARGEVVSAYDCGPAGCEGYF